MSIYEIKIKSVILLFQLLEISKEEARKIILNQILDLEFENFKEFKKVMNKKETDEDLKLAFSLVNL